MKRPAHLTWSKGGGSAHGKPVNGLFAYSPFTARYPKARYALFELGPVASSGPSNMIPAHLNLMGRSTCQHIIGTSRPLDE